MIGRVIDDRYRIVRQLGAGGMGVVYAAHHEITGREVAIKLLHPNAQHSDEMLARFVREARTAAAIGHPNIVEILDAGTLADATPFLVMELLHGEALGSLLGRETRLTPERAADVVSQAARALAALHAQGVIHRDVKTDNLFVGHDGRVKLLDFGLAVFTDGRVNSKLTQEGIFNGTPQYMPPDVFDGGEPNVGWDVYALATVTFELLTGVVPFEDANPIVMLYNKRESVAPRLADRSNAHFSEELERVIRRGLERDPKHRHATPIAFAEQFARAAAGHEETSSTQTMPALDAGTSARTADANATGSRTSVHPRGRMLEPLVRWRSWLAAPALLGACALALFMTRATPEPGEPSSIAVEPAPEADVTREPQRAEAPSPSEPVLPQAAVAPRQEPSSPGPIERPRTSPPRTRARGWRATSPAGAARRTSTDDAGVVLASVDALRAGVAAAEEEAADVRGEVGAAVDRRADEATARDLVRQGTAALMRGMILDAIDMLRRATVAAPQSSSAWRGLGLANERLGRSAEARRAYARYLTLAPTAGDATEVRRRVEALRPAQ